MKLLVCGLTSTTIGGMEHRNLGNFVIVEPLFGQLRERFPDAEITTTIQMSDGFCARHRVMPLRKKRFWSYGRRTGPTTIVDILKVLLWKLTGCCWFLRSSTLLREIDRADVVIDFSGDLYGDNAYWAAFLENNARLVFAMIMHKPIATIFGSPGPFRVAWRRAVARRVLPRLDLVINRDPLSREVLRAAGISTENVHDSVCPSILFEPAPLAQIEAKRDRQALFRDSRPVLGLILCGWNMPVGPFGRWPRADSEYAAFVALVRHLLSATTMRICLMAHQNAVDRGGRIVRGNDHNIIDQLFRLVHDHDAEGRVFVLDDLYDAAESKTVIGRFEVLVSGRIHGAVQGLSQAVPTSIIEYGHEPKAHKLRGFAQVYGVEDYVCDPEDADELCRRVDRLIAERDAVRSRLLERLPALKKATRQGFAMVDDLAHRKA